MPFPVLGIFAAAAGGVPLPASINFLVIAGGGGGGGRRNYYEGTGGGGAGGYRTSVGTTGGGGATESALTRTLTSYTVTVGAGGPGAFDSYGTQGSSSVFGTITTVGGGAGARGNNAAGGNGGSGGGGGFYYDAEPQGGLGTANQGYNAGNGNARGGGGAGGTSTDWNAPGIGIYSDITGTSTPRAGGGFGMPDVYFSGAKTIYGGGGLYANRNATINTGSGGGGKTYEAPVQDSGAGGSGLVVLRYGSEFAPLIVGAGLVYTLTTVGANQVYTFTSGTDTISW